MVLKKEKFQQISTSKQIWENNNNSKITENVMKCSFFFLFLCMNISEGYITDLDKGVHGET